MKITEPPIIVNQLFEQSIETLWKAITEIGQMR
jgi:hypothetical protein